MDIHIKTNTNNNILTNISMVVFGIAYIIMYYLFNSCLLVI